MACLVVRTAGTVCCGYGGILVGGKPPILNNKHNSSVANYFFDCVESYDLYITYPSSNDAKSPLVNKVYFDCISSLSNFNNL